MGFLINLDALKISALYFDALIETDPCAEDDSAVYGALLLWFRRPRTNCERVDAAVH